MDRIAQAPAEERTDLFQRAAAEIQPQRAPAIIEKDFWVCWALRRIFEVLRFQPRLIFKGGTSLSKAYNAIERFSEDVDLFFASAWASYDTATPGGFHLLPANRRIADLRSDYKEMKAMIFGAYPEWDEIIEGLAALERRINNLA